MYLHKILDTTAQIASNNMKHFFIIKTLDYLCIFVLRKHTKKAVPLIDGIKADYLLADRGYDTNQIIEFATGFRMIAVVSPKQNRKEKPYYNEYLYKLRHLVENASSHLKRWRGIATRYCKNTGSFLAVNVN